MREVSEERARAGNLPDPILSGRACHSPTEAPLTGETESGLFGVFSSPVYRPEAVRYYFRHRYERISLRDRLPRRLWLVLAAAAAVTMLLAGVARVPMVRSVPLIVCPVRPLWRMNLVLAPAADSRVLSNAGPARLFEGGSVFRVSAVDRPIPAGLSRAVAACRASNGPVLHPHGPSVPLGLVLVGTTAPHAGPATLEVGAGRLRWLLFQTGAHGASMGRAK